MSYEKLDYICKKLDELQYESNLKFNHVLYKISNVNKDLMEVNRKLSNLDMDNTIIYRLIDLNNDLIDLNSASVKKETLFCLKCVDDFTCAICYEKNLDNKIITSCNHIFHQECLKIWYDIKKECPFCRKKIFM